jgi:hypothetical protein
MVFSPILAPTVAAKAVPLVIPSRRRPEGQATQVRLPGYASNKREYDKAAQHGYPKRHWNGYGEEHHSHPGVEHGQCPAKCKNSTGSAYGPGVDITQPGIRQPDVKQAAYYASYHVDYPELSVAQHTQDGTAEEIEGPHIEKDMEKVLVSEHAGDDLPGVAPDVYGNESEGIYEFRADIDTDENQDIYQNENEDAVQNGYLLVNN